ncbi:very short patch repair endonuclease [Paenarthrobacter nicotinovorans]|uniref:very short patch repair endonuclease n=1 Tax=Paenarthrobacter nicotinovorans TaxID=29320 RepID=UPI003DA5E7E6
MTRDSWASSPQIRKVMQNNKSRDTRPELAVRRAAHALGLRYRVSTRPLPDLPRTADMVFSKLRIAVFIDGCYWHKCPVHYRPSRTNETFWRTKIDRNVERDAETTTTLTEAGWKVLRFWSHEDPSAVAHVIQDVVTDFRIRQVDRSRLEA